MVRMTQPKRKDLVSLCHLIVIILVFRFIKTLHSIFDVLGSLFKSVSRLHLLSSGKENIAYLWIEIECSREMLDGIPLLLKHFVESSQ